MSFLQGGATGGQDPQGQDHWAQGQGGQQGRHPEVIRLLEERAPFQPFELEVLGIIPAPGKEFPAKVRLTVNELCIDFGRLGIRPSLANLLWQQGLDTRPSNKQPVTLRLRPGDISVIAIATNSITLLFAIRPNDSFCSVVVLYLEGQAERLAAFGRALALWSIPPDNLMYINPKEDLPAYQWLMAQASDRGYDQQEEANITYDTDLYYFHNCDMLDTVWDALYKHTKYELKKALAIVAHRLLSRLRPILERHLHQQLNASFATSDFAMSSFETPAANFEVLSRDFSSFCDCFDAYCNFYPQVDNANWDDPAVVNAESLLLPPIQRFFDVFPRGVTNLLMPEGQTRVQFNQTEEPITAILVYNAHYPRMRLYRSAHDRWCVVERIEFRRVQLVITHRDEWAQPEDNAFVQHMNYVDIGYFRHSVVGQSVTAFSIHPLYQWGYFHFECQEPLEIALVQALLRWRLCRAGQVPQDAPPVAISPVDPKKDLRAPAIAALFPRDQHRWHSPEYGWIQAEVRRNRQAGQGGGGRETEHKRTEWTIDKNFRAFTVRLVNKLAIGLARRMFVHGQWGRHLMDGETWDAWTAYCECRDVAIRKVTRSQCTVPQLVPRGDQYRMPFEWMYALFDAPNEY